MNETLHTDFEEHNNKLHRVFDEYSGIQEIAAISCVLDLRVQRNLVESVYDDKPLQHQIQDTTVRIFCLICE